MIERRTNGKSKYEPVVQTDFAEVFAKRNASYESFPVTIGTHLRRMLDPRAEYALRFLDRWGMVMSDVDGEDAAGRQKVRLMTAEEVSERACVCADAIFKKINDRGWVTVLPTMKELAELVKDQDDTND